jgi:hypothetical protein
VEINAKGRVKIKTRNFIIAAVLWALPFSGPAVSMGNASADEDFESNVEYGNYLFVARDDRLVKFPLDKKARSEAEFVMKFPEKTYMPWEVQFFLNDGDLYINLSVYQEHGGLYRLTSPQGKPKSVLRMQAAASSGLSFVRDSKVNPKELKFIVFFGGDAGYWMWSLYYYLPHKGKPASYLVSGVEWDNMEQFEIMGDDSILYKKDNSINRLVLDLATETVRVMPLIPKNKMPSFSDWHLNQDETKLYLLGDFLWAYDMAGGTLEKIFDFNKAISNWPSGNGAYYDNEFYEYSFSWIGEKLNVFNGKKTFLFDVVNRDYQSWDILQLTEELGKIRSRKVALFRAISVAQREYRNAVAGGSDGSSQRTNLERRISEARDAMAEIRKLTDRELEILRAMMEIKLTVKNPERDWDAIVKEYDESAVNIVKDFCQSMEAVVDTLQVQ